jgi:hypothetical protein
MNGSTEALNPMVEQRIWFATGLMGGWAFEM